MTDKPLRCNAPHPTDPDATCQRSAGHIEPHYSTLALGWPKDAEEPLGAYTRHESPDYMDGGVTAAAVEAEANQARNDQARIDHIHEQDRIIRRRNAQIAVLEGKLRAEFRRAEEAEAAACPDRDVHWRYGEAVTDLGAVKATSEEIEKQLAAAILERDHFQEVANTFRSKFDEADARAEKAEQERDEAVTELQARIELDIATERPLGPEDITDDYATRVADYLRLHGQGVVPHLVMLEALTAALTPPARPEWADLADVLGDFAIADEHSGDRDDMILAQRLHERGVRVVSEEQP